MVTTMTLGKLAVDVVLKDIKNVHLSVHPPTGRLRISAPARMSLNTIRVFAISKLGWIEQERRKIQNQDREARRDYVDRESHYVWGRRYLLTIYEIEGPPQVEIAHGRMVLRTRPGTPPERREAIVEEWYRRQLKQAVELIVRRWEPLIGVTVTRYFVQRMKTKWGSCNAAAGSIRLNTDLAKKPHECLEYIVVHEMAHLLEPNHGPRFVALMDSHLPHWRLLRERLNRLPLRHEDWAC